MNTKRYWLFWMVMIGLVFILANIRRNNLLKNFKQSQGVVVKVFSGGKTTPGIQFSIDNEKSYYKPLMGSSLRCRSKVKALFKDIQKYKFPVVYSPLNHQNAEILLFESQYEMYRIEIPQNLRDVVKELSECER